MVSNPSRAPRPDQVGWRPRGYVILSTLLRTPTDRGSRSRPRDSICLDPSRDTHRRWFDGLEHAVITQVGYSAVCTKETISNSMLEASSSSRWIGDLRAAFPRGTDPRGQRLDQPFWRRHDRRDPQRLPHSRRAHRVQRLWHRHDVAIRRCAERGYDRRDTRPNQLVYHFGPVHGATAAVADCLAGSWIAQLIPLARSHLLQRCPAARAHTPAMRRLYSASAASRRFCAVVSPGTLCDGWM